LARSGLPLKKGQTPPPPNAPQSLALWEQVLTKALEAWLMGFAMFQLIRSGVL